MRVEYWDMAAPFQLEIHCFKASIVLQLQLQAQDQVQELGPHNRQLADVPQCHVEAVGSSLVKVQTRFCCLAKGINLLVLTVLLLQKREDIEEVTRLKLQHCSPPKLLFQVGVQHFGLDGVPHHVLVEVIADKVLQGTVNPTYLKKY